MANQNGYIKKIAILLGVFGLTGATIAACEQQGGEFTIEHGYSDFNEDEKPEINDQVTIKEGSLIYEKPDDAIFGINGKEPNIDYDAEIIISAVACIGPNEEFEIDYNPYNEQLAISNGYKRAAVQLKSNGTIIGYVNPQNIKTKGMQKIIK